MNAKATLTLTGNMGAAVVQFATRMYATLRRHEPEKGGREGWVDEGVDDLLVHLESEVRELREKLKELGEATRATGPQRRALRELAALETTDVANLALMIHDVLVDLLEFPVESGSSAEDLAAAQARLVTPKRADDLPVGGAVNHPKHYNQGGIEVIEVLKAFGWAVPFCLGNAVKYILRAEHKGNRVEDLEKARWYLDYALTYLKAQVKP